MGIRILLSAFFCFTVCTARAWAQDAASLQFTVAAPDPVMAGEEVRLQTLVVNTGSQPWPHGTYYWSGEIYALEGDTRKFITQTVTITPPEDVAPGAAHGSQIPFTVPENMQGRRLLYRVFLIKDGKRILETDYKGFQVIEKEFRPPAPQDFKLGGDITFSYKNSSRDGWDDHQGVTAANFVGKVRQSSFLFNTYIIHTYHRPITPSIVLLNYYAPWGNLSVGDISPTLTPLSMDAQGMRGVSYERARGRFALTALIGRIVAPEEPDSSSAGRFARFTGGFKTSWQLLPNLRVAADAVMSRDEEHSIIISTPSNNLKPQENAVYGFNAEWKFLRYLTWNSDYQMSSYKADMTGAAPAVSGTAWKQELKYKGSLVNVRGSLSRIDPAFASFASPSVIADRTVLDGEVGFFPADWETFTFGFNSYEDNLDKDPLKATTKQSQASFANMLRILGKTMVNTSLIINTTKAQPASVQDNETTTMNFSVTQPWSVHTLNLGYQTSAFKDKTGLSSDLDTALISVSGAFKLTPRLSASAGMVNSTTKDKQYSTTGKNNSITGNFSYAIPRKAMAVQFWTTLSSNNNDSLFYPTDSNSLSLNLETVWLKSQGSRFTFGVGMISKTDNLNPAADSSEINILTRYNYSF
ncbi:MAG TPA: hypothetical protein PKI19_02555 [Elusimicrobiales bacterium]|nr:hypothetical protein [Elusimicrobiales bacterium]